MKDKKFAYIFIALGLLFINVIPDPTDVLTLQIYSAFTGADISPSNLSSVYLDFTIWSLIIGSISLLIGMYYMNWSFGRLLKKLNLDKYGVSILLAIASVLIISFFEISPVWLVFLIVPIAYWFYIKKDKSECLGLFLTSWILYIGGLEILMSFVFNRILVPEVILNSNIFLNWLAVTLGLTQVTNTVLVSGVFISFIVVLLTTKVLKEYF